MEIENVQDSTGAIIGSRKRHSDEEIARIAATARRQGETYRVPSSDGSRDYRVTPISCTCPDFEYRGETCKHMEAISLLCPPVAITLPVDVFEGFDAPKPTFQPR